MALILLYQVALIAFVSCQTQNSTDLFEAENTTTQYYMATQIPSYDSDTIANETSVVPVTEISSSDIQGADVGDDGKAEDLADYFLKKAGELLGGGEEANKEIEATTPSEADLRNCSLPAVLDRFCEGVPDDVYAYFKNDMSLHGILTSIFYTDVVDALHLNCTPGSWCLSDAFHQDITQSMNRFYTESPFCSSAMWTCVIEMQDKRSSCGEEELSYLANTIVLLCDLQGLGHLSQECYARTVETLYVTYADMTNPIGSQKMHLEVPDCNDYKVQLTKTYLCADDVCNFDQNMLLEKFQSWVWMAQQASETAMTCNISSTCQSTYTSDVYDETTSYGYDDNYNNNDNYDSDSYDGDSYVSDNSDSDVYEDEGNTYQDVLTEIEDKIKEEEEEEENGQNVNEDEGSENEEDSGSYGSNQFGNENEIHADSNDGYDEQDRSMMVGLIILTTGLLFGFLGLAFIVYRRFKRARNGNYKWGYSQLTTEDARIVHNDYK